MQTIKFKSIYKDFIDVGISGMRKVNMIFSGEK